MVCAVIGLSVMLKLVKLLREPPGRKLFGAIFLCFSIASSSFCFLLIDFKLLVFEIFQFVGDDE
jgi:hypothetical protein